MKRAERPPPEFWAEFDRKLRAKQLAALVEKRPWWQRLPRSFPRFARYRVLLGAASVVALSFLTMREYQTASTDTPVPSVIESASVAVAPIASMKPTAEVAAVNSLPELAPVSAPRPTVAASTTLTVDPMPASELSRVISLGGAKAAELEAEPNLPTGRYVPATLTVAQNTEPLPSRGLLAARNGFETRALPTRTAVEPLQQMSPPGEARRARMLTAMVSMDSFEASVRTTERAANRIAEERLYDQNQRFGARGAGVQMKF